MTRAATLFLKQEIILHYINIRILHLCLNSCCSVISSNYSTSMDQKTKKPPIGAFLLKLPTSNMVDTDDASVLHDSGKMEPDGSPVMKKRKWHGFCPLSGGLCRKNPPSVLDEVSGKHSEVNTMDCCLQSEKTADSQDPSLLGWQLEENSSALLSDKKMSENVMMHISVTGLPPKGRVSRKMKSVLPQELLASVTDTVRKQVSAAASNLSAQQDLGSSLQLGAGSALLKNFCVADDEAKDDVEISSSQAGHELEADSNDLKKERNCKQVAVAKLDGSEDCINEKLTGVSISLSHSRILKGGGNPPFSTNRNNLSDLLHGENRSLELLQNYSGFSSQNDEFTDNIPTGNERKKIDKSDSKTDMLEYEMSQNDSNVKHSTIKKNEIKTVEDEKTSLARNLSDMQSDFSSFQSSPLLHENLHSEDISQSKEPEFPFAGVEIFEPTSISLEDSDRIYDLSVLFTKKNEKAFKRQERKAQDRLRKKNRNKSSDADISFCSVTSKTDDDSDVDAKKAKRMLPNHFIAIQVSDKQVVEAIKKVQLSIMKKKTDYALAMIPLHSLHLSLIMMHLGNEEDLQRAKKALDLCAQELLPQYKVKPLSLSLAGVGHFKHAVVFSKFVDDSELDKLREILNVVTKHYDSVRDDGKSFIPHVTIMKMSRIRKKMLRKLSFKRFDPSVFEEFCNMEFGCQTVESLQLCAMHKLDKSGYYHVEHCIQFVQDSSADSDNVSKHCLDEETSSATDIHQISKDLVRTVIEASLDELRKEKEKMNKPEETPYLVQSVLEDDKMKKLDGEETPYLVQSVLEDDKMKKLDGEETPSLVQRVLEDQEMTRKPGKNDLVQCVLEDSR